MCHFNCHSLIKALGQFFNNSFFLATCLQFNLYMYIKLLKTFMFLKKIKRIHLFCNKLIIIIISNKNCNDQVIPANEHPRGRREQADRCQAPRLCCSSVHWLHSLQSKLAGYVEELFKNEIVKRNIHISQFKGIFLLFIKLYRS